MDRNNIDAFSKMKLPFFNFQGNSKLMIFLSILLFLVYISKAQTPLDIQQIRKVTNIPALEKFSAELKVKAEINREKAEETALKSGWPLKEKNKDGGGIELRELRRNGMPVYLSTGNLTAAKTVSTNKVWSGGGLGFNLSGSGITLREWDENAVRQTHQELTGRVTQGDGVVTLSGHSTHVAGTMMATGIDANAHGMAGQSTLRSFDWWSDYAEMASEATAGALLSNHSYVFLTGWYNSGSWYWYGDPAISEVEDYTYGFYGDDAAYVDYIALSAPYYLICKSAGNEKGRGPASQPVSHYVWDGTAWVLSTTVRNLNGMPSGYDCISNGFGVSKNVLTVGAAYGIPGGYSVPSDVVLASFSSTGPCDDGRIKPDIVADGISLYSTYSSADNAYASMSGTSMSTPSATGSLALLQEHYHNLHGNYMLAATLKGLVIHTADEAGSNPGPDYKFGWGLLNTGKAANLISNSTTASIKELSLNNGATYTMNIKSNGTEPLKVTICWNDIYGTPPSPSLNPPDIMLVNDLDIRIDGSTYQPWILDRTNPSFAAASGDNIRDNVEQILISGISAGCHILTVSHKGTLSGGSQAYSLIISGITVYPPTIPGNTTGGTTISLGLPTDTLEIHDYSGTILTWQRRLNGGSYTDIPGTEGIFRYVETPASIGTWDFRCTVQNGECDTQYSAATTVSVVENPPERTWTGAIDGKWNRAGNWTPSGIPSSLDDVIIPGTVSPLPVVDKSGLSCHNLFIQPGAVVIVNTGITLTVNGTLTIENE